MAKRRDVLKAIPFAPAALFAAGAPKLPGGVIDPKSAKVSHEPFGDLRVYYEGPTDQVRSMTAGSLLLKPGMSPHPPHQHEEEEFMVITQGAGEISVEGKITKVGPGSMMYSPANRLHGIVNSGKVDLLFYYYKWKA
jgi:mannose-6-phosphate isomerase-like protein (cupin superfamily)